MRISRSTSIATTSLFAFAVCLLAPCPSCHPTVCGPSDLLLRGPSTGVVRETLTFKVVAIDTTADSIAYSLDWGDSTRGSWTGFASSGESVTVSHAFRDSNDYVVKAKAKNSKGAESDWTGGLPVSVIGRGPGYPDSLVGRVWSPQAGRGYLRSLVVSLDGERLYVTSTNDSLVYVMRTSDYGMIDSIIAGHMPWSMCLSPDGQSLYVLAEEEDSLVVVRTSDNRVVAKVGVGSKPEALAVTPDGRYLYVTASGEDAVDVVRTSDYSLYANMPVARQPKGIAMSPDGQTAYVASSGQGAVDVIRTDINGVTSRIKLPSGGISVACSRDGNWVYAGCSSGDIAVISTSIDSVVGMVHLKGNPRNTVATPDGCYAVVANDEWPGMPVLRLGANEQIGILNCDWPVFSVAVAPSGNKVYAAVQDEGVFVFAGSHPSATSVLLSDAE